MNIEIWTSALNGGVIGTLLALVAIPLVRIVLDLSNKPDSKVIHANILVYSVYAFGVLLFSCLSFVAFNYEHVQFPYEAKLAFGSIFCFLAILCVEKIFDTFFRKLTWDEKGLTLFELGRPKIQKNWSDLEDIRWHSFQQEWKLEFKGGHLFTIPSMMSGSDRFFEGVVYVYRKDKFGHFQDLSDFY